MNSISGSIFNGLNNPRNASVGYAAQTHHATALTGSQGPWCVRRLVHASVATKANISP
jgi:hypothetical protein